MTIVTTDASSALYHWLKSNAAAASIRALVYSGERNVLEDGDLSPEILSESFAARHKANERDKILALTVHDAGENKGQASVIVRFYDRHEGYRNIRAVRDLFIEAWKAYEEIAGLSLTAVNGRPRGVVYLDYAARTGHLKLANYVCDYEALALTGEILYGE